MCAHIPLASVERLTLLDLYTFISFIKLQMKFLYFEEEKFFFFLMKISKQIIIEHISCGIMGL